MSVCTFTLPSATTKLKKDTKSGLFLTQRQQITSAARILAKVTFACDMVSSQLVTALQPAHGRTVDTYGLRKFCGSSAEVDDVFLLHVVESVPVFRCLLEEVFVVQRCEVIVASKVSLGLRLRLSPPASVSVDAIYPTVACCVHVPRVNYITIGNNSIQHCASQKISLNYPNSSAIISRISVSYRCTSHIIIKVQMADET